MKQFLAIVPLSLLLAMSGCHDEVRHAHSDPEKGHDHSTGTHDHDDHAGHAHVDHKGPDGKVQLDNGQRWQANKETTEGIARMQELVGSYEPGSGDIEKLRRSLEEEFALIFERCTMEGEAHVQLHNYLLPMHKELTDLSAGDLHDLGEYLATYQTYFK